MRSLDRTAANRIYHAAAVPLVIVVMTMVGTIAVAAPARRGLNIQPTEALREE